MKIKTLSFSGLLIICFFITTALSAQTSINGKDTVGVWKTIDDETGVTKSLVEIYKKGSKYNAKIVKLLDKQTLINMGEERFEDILCKECPENHGKNEKLEGLEIIWNMEKTSKKYKGGKIMDPADGKTYSCTMWMEDENTIKVRGWLTILYRTQTWYRVQ
ncbi:MULTISPECIES: DUF2147 domain-containing protein [unclassified Polaribacter]|uniref:DUF2147 domain-containing protein n=1 Tax=unclassified Polaribacter TaxID=196858 RepID=UPI0011BDB35A|nr:MULTISPECIES: DUF2147 domain-containing protein [unclassified Polaribacter]TXD51716.1 DUF2147 domain-containing protein [Polaribacter sp. IC063]TXD59533.1 DUF2147 domain-containing protein [Polaribacter sp. IC066]